MWFKKKNKITPIVKFNGITAEIEKDWSDLSWKFTYKKIEFNTEDHILNIPSTDELDEYLAWIEKNKTHIEKSITETMKEWGGNINAAKVAAITIENKNKISVLYLGDDTWGDMGGDFIIENGNIVNEGWAD